MTIEALPTSPFKNGRTFTVVFDVGN